MQERAMACNGYTKGVLFLATEVAKCIGTAAHRIVIDVVRPSYRGC